MKLITALLLLAALASKGQNKDTISLKVKSRQPQDSGQSAIEIGILNGKGFIASVYMDSRHRSVQVIQHEGGIIEIRCDSLSAIKLLINHIEQWQKRERELSQRIEWMHGYWNRTIEKWQQLIRNLKK
jgi:hypothetical protein